MHSSLALWSSRIVKMKKGKNRGKKGSAVESIAPRAIITAARDVEMITPAFFFCFCFRWFTFAFLLFIFPRDWTLAFWVLWKKGTEKDEHFATGVVWPESARDAIKISCNYNCCFNVCLSSHLDKWFPSNWLSASMGIYRRWALYRGIWPSVR